MWWVGWWWDDCWLPVFIKVNSSATGQSCPTLMNMTEVSQIPDTAKHNKSWADLGRWTVCTTTGSRRQINCSTGWYEANWAAPQPAKGCHHCSGSLEPESSCHDRDWIMELPMEADILTFTGIFTPGDASVASCFPFDITISLSWFPLLSIPPLHSAIP